ncbi:MAG: acyl-CoA dehydrogenase family protein [Sneathiellaceae bacterium]
MDFSLSDEQKLLSDSVQRFVRERYEFETWRSLAKSDDGFSRENWAQMAELGWFGISFPEEVGGLGGSPVDTMIMVEEMGKGNVLEPFVSSVVLCGTLVAKAGSDAQKEDLLAKIIDGSAIVALAHAEAQARYNLADVMTEAKADGGGFTITGRKIVVFDAPAADRIIVLARTAGGQRDRDGLSLFLVDRDAAGVERRDYRTIDNRRASEIAFNGCKVGADALLGPKDGAWPFLEAATDHAIAALCSEACGAMQKLQQTTVEYSKTRKQFGVPIGSFQVLQHRMVDMMIHAEEAKSLAMLATLKLDAEPQERARAVSAAKVQLSKAGRYVGQQAVQIHGGMGMTDELDVGHYFKHLMALETRFGDGDHHLKRFSDLS